MERIDMAAGNPAMTRAAAAEAGSLDHIAIRLREMVAAAVRVREQIDALAQLRLEFEPSADDLVARGVAAHLPQVGVRPRVRADIEPAAPQGSHVIPCHPRMPCVVFAVP